jgi:hypothetical protein
MIPAEEKNQEDQLVKSAHSSWTIKEIWFHFNRVEFLPLCSVPRNKVGRAKNIPGQYLFPRFAVSVFSACLLAIPKPQFNTR